MDSGFIIRSALTIDEGNKKGFVRSRAVLAQRLEMKIEIVGTEKLVELRIVEGNGEHVEFEHSVPSWAVLAQILKLSPPDSSLCSQFESFSLFLARTI